MSILDPNPALFFSQNGEDLVLAHLFAGRTGRFVEIGCIDGQRFSNTLHFARNGWTGLCIEAHRDYLPLLRRNRPESRIVHAAVGAEDRASVTFYANARGSLSTLEPSHEERFRREFGPWFSGFSEQQVPLRRLSSILDEDRDPAVDFVSIDVEGSELAVLAGIDFARHRPKVLVIEADDDLSLHALEAHLIPKDYLLIGQRGNNAFFAEKSFAGSLHPTPVHLSGLLTLTPHPLDNAPLTIRDCHLWWPHPPAQPPPNA